MVPDYYGPATTRILSDDSKPIDYDPRTLEDGMIIEFAYKPLIGRRKEYRCSIISAGKKNLAAIIHTEHPTFLWFGFSKNWGKTRRFAFDRIEMYSIRPREKEEYLSTAQVAGMYLGQDGKFMDEHGNIRY